MNESAVLAAGALLPALCLAQPATAPGAADSTGAAALNQIATLQQQQLLTLQQLVDQQSRPAVLDDRRACVMADEVYTEGAPAKGVDGKTYVCTRVYPTAGQGHERLVWLAAPATAP